MTQRKFVATGIIAGLLSLAGFVYVGAVLLDELAEGESELYADDDDGEYGG